MKNIIILDLDGVLILTPSWKADKLHWDGYSNFDGEAVKWFNQLLDETNAELWLSSSRRASKTLNQFREIFENRKINTRLEGVLPLNCSNDGRKTEIDAFLDQKSIKNFLIIDDDKSLNELREDRKVFWVQTLPLIGFTEEKMNEAQLKIKNWK